MERNELVEEIRNYCLDYGVQIEPKVIESIIKQGLQKAELIEIIYNNIFITAQRSKGENMDIDKVKELLNELHKIQLGFEFMDS